MKKAYIVTKKRVLCRISGTTKKPRLNVFRSHKHIYAQLIDDQAGRTLAEASTLSKEIRMLFSHFATKKASYVVGQLLAQRAKCQNINKVIFDRGRRQYHGRVKSLAEGARAEGLIF